LSQYLFALERLTKLYHHQHNIKIKNCTQKPEAPSILQQKANLFNVNEIRNYYVGAATGMVEAKK
jgi:hypothetical protein